MHTDKETRVGDLCREGTHRPVYVYVRMCICAYMCFNICMCMCVCVYVHICALTHACIYAYGHKDTCTSLIRHVCFLCTHTHYIHIQDHNRECNLCMFVRICIMCMRVRVHGTDTWRSLTCIHVCKHAGASSLAIMAEVKCEPEVLLQMAEDGAIEALQVCSCVLHMYVKCLEWSYLWLKVER
jgi:hypothetical protein